ncbi:DSBA-like thioredoxin domain-containing protein [Seiridium cupressi]
MASIKDLLSPIKDAANSPGPPSRSAMNQFAPAPENLHFTVEFILDTICPHCYIGLRNLNTAIRLYKEQQPNATFEVTCSPIVLNPGAGRSVGIKGTYYERTRGFASSTIEAWTRQGVAVGIQFDWQGGLTGNSRDSHKLLRLALEANPSTYRSSSFTQASGYNRSVITSSSAQQSTVTPGARGPDTQMKLAETIYREYFENNHDISDRSWLLNIGTSLTDLPAAEIRACLESEDWNHAIDRLSDRSKQEFNAVPVFIIQGRYVAGGWQTPEKFLEVFEGIRLAGPNAPGGMLSVPGGGWWMPGGVFRGASQAASQGAGLSPSSANAGN